MAVFGGWFLFANSDEPLPRFPADSGGAGREGAGWPRSWGRASAQAAAASPRARPGCAPAPAGRRVPGPRPFPPHQAPRCPRERTAHPHLRPPEGAPATRRPRPASPAPAPLLGPGGPWRSCREIGGTCSSQLRSCHSRSPSQTDRPHAGEAPDFTLKIIPWRAWPREVAWPAGTLVCA